jgi:ribonuclease HI
MPNSYTQYIAYFDGACEPINPGGTATYGAVIIQAGEPIWMCSEVYQPAPGHEHQTSNNLADHSGLIAVLKWFASQGLFDAEISVYGDSALVINQVFGTWRIKKGLYAPLAHKAHELLEAFDRVQGQWISRERNTVADLLSKAPLKRAGVSLRLQRA